MKPVHTFFNEENISCYILEEDGRVKEASVA